MAQLGVSSLMLPEDCGGIGLGAMEMCVVAEEVGRQLSPVPLASTMYLAVQAVLLSTQEQSAQRRQWLPPVSWKHWLSGSADGRAGTAIRSCPV